ncbi:MAG: hypothetical protein ACYTDY_08825, partial [Planctomycetota bacterium]
MRILPWTVLLVALLLPHAAGQSPCGTIDQTGATIETGPGDPQGTLTIDPCRVGGSPPPIPELGTIGTIPAMTGTLPTFPGAGTGLDGPYDPTGDDTLPGGVYNHTSYTVDAGVTVTYTGAVTINTTEGVRIDGEVMSTVAGASITFRSAGGFDMFGAPGTPAILSATSSDSHVDILTNGTITLGDALISSQSGNASVVCLGLAGSAPAFTMNGSVIEAPMGDVEVRSQWGLDIGDSILNTDGGKLLAQTVE